MIREKIEKLQEAPPARLAKPIPVLVLVYISKKKKKRGGQQQRKTMKLYGITETRKMANRVQFGVPEDRGDSRIFVRGVNKKHKLYKI